MGAKSVPDGKVSCEFARVCVSCHMRDCFYCTSSLSHIPRVMWGRLLQDGGEHVGVAYCMWKHACCPQSSWYSTCRTCFIACTWTTCLGFFFLYSLYLHTAPGNSWRIFFVTWKNTEVLPLHCIVRCNKSLILLKRYWLRNCNPHPSCCYTMPGKP